MAKAISDLLKLQKQINDIEIEFDMRRMLLDHKHDYALKEAYKLRTRILMGLNENAGVCEDFLKLCDDDTYNMERCESSNDYTQGYYNNSNMNKRNMNDNLIRRQIRDGVVNENSAIKGFWYSVFTNSEQLSNVIRSHDKEALSYLIDVSSDMNISNMRSDNNFTFTLSFNFLPNPYFNNRILTKEYFVEVTIDKQNPIKYYGPRIYKSIGCIINWKTGMDLTKKVPPRRPSRRKSSATSWINNGNKSIDNVNNNNNNNDGGGVFKQKYFKIKEWLLCGGNDSFFNFFSFPELPENVSLDSEDEALLEKDFQLGWHIKDEIIPRALFYFVGDNSESEIDEDSDSSSSGDDDDSSVSPDEAEGSYDSESNISSSEHSSESS